MNVLVLHRGSLATSPYDKWTADHDGEVVLLASREQIDHFGEKLPEPGNGYRHVEAIRDYDTGGRVEARALELARRYGVGHVIATQERDMERAAQLREILGLPGQRLDSVIAFRDKVLMKSMVSSAGIPVAPYAEVACAVDLISFAGKHGFPIVVKPRDGGGSVGLRFIHSKPELDAFLTGHFDLYGEDLPNLIVESFVHGPVCHVDGLVVGGRIVYAWPSQYLYVLARYKGDRGGRYDVTLDADDPLTQRLIEFIERVIDTLPGPSDFAFHAEVFHNTDDELVLCEIACTTGGAAQRDIQRTLFGIEPTETWVRAQLGLALPVDTSVRLRPARLTGQLVLLKRPGKVLALPGDPPFPWVESARVFVRPGDVMDEPAFAADFMAMFVVSAPTRKMSESRMRELETWFLNAISIEAPEDRDVG
jgi:D-ala D-ala ligase C-terminus